MLGKLAYRNTKRNIKDYLIYLITVTASFSLIFAFNLVASSDEIVKLCSSMDAFKNSLFAVNILIIFVIYYIVTNSKFAYEVEDNKDIETITVANKNLKLKGYDTKSYWNSITNTGRFVVVLPDKYVQGLEVSENHLIIDTKEETDAELENKIKEDMQHQLVKVDKNGEINDESYRVNVRGAEIEQQKAMVAIVASLFMYIAFILISAVGTILAVQSLSDSTKYKYRYLTLRRLGINDKSLFKTIRKQLLILFCVPAISAILCSFVMMSSLNNVYQQILGDKHLYLIYFGLNLIIFFLIYSIYWIATYIGFKRNINEES
ncbi:FtsX-like permease family protein [Coprococcus comes]|uniref:hypothetical protein n=1 Tax=Coprococcus comes TaxID=410072 RepID=UPI001C02988E|nr:hypothetical protein [Coprococcus comes]MBT9764634.1 FtsX-like permease family protein [Coprococcus comes]